MAFNPDAYLAETAPVPTSNPAFDPDKYLAETAPPPTALGVGGSALAALAGVPGLSGMLAGEAAAAPSGKAPTPTAPPGPSDLTTDARQLVSGATAGFDAPIVGAIGAVGRAAGVQNLGSWKPFDPSSHLQTTAPTADFNKILQAYRENRDATRADAASDRAASPVRSMVASTVGTALSPLSALKIAQGTGVGASAANAAAQGAVLGLGHSNADLTKGELGPAALDMAKGAGVGGAIGGAVGGIANTFSPNNLDQAATGLLRNATGATGKEAQKFTPGSDTWLRKNVGFLDNPSNIADKAGDAITGSEQGINQSLDGLNGTTVDRQDVIDYIQNKIADLSKLSSNNGLVKQLEDRIEDISSKIPGYATESSVENAADSSASEMPIMDAELEKRGWQNQANYNNPKADQADKIVADAFRKGVEDSATAADPALSKQFQDAKQLYGDLQPIAAASAKRSATLNQSPAGGVLDTASALGGLTSGHPLTAVAAPIARRELAPRLASGAGVTAAKLADIVRTAPQLLGPFQQVLSSAAQRGAISLAATNQILNQTSEAYRQHMNSLTEGQK